MGKTGVEPQQEKKRYCYYFLLRGKQLRGKAEIRREDKKRVRVTIEGYSYGLFVDERDPRTLICFDGDIPSSGLQKGALWIDRSDVPALTCHIDRVYQSRIPYEDEVRYMVRESIARQPLIRHFILMPACRAVFRIYRPDSL